MAKRTAAQVTKKQNITSQGKRRKKRAPAFGIKSYAASVLEQYIEQVILDLIIVQVRFLS